MCALSALVNMEIGPRCRVAYTSILFNLRLELTAPNCPKASSIKDFKGYIFYVNKNRGGELEDVMVWVLKDETNLVTFVRAARGKVEVDAPNRRVNLNLYDGKSRDLRDDRIILEFLYGTSATSWTLARGRTTFRPAISDMTCGQLWDELQEWEQRLKVPGSVRTSQRSNCGRRRRSWRSWPVTRPPRSGSRSTSRWPFPSPASASRCVGHSAGHPDASARDQRRHRRGPGARGGVLTASSCWARRSTPGRNGAPHLIVWLPNFIFQAVGAVLLWRANRGCDRAALTRGRL